MVIFASKAATEQLEDAHLFLLNAAKRTLPSVGFLVVGHQPVEEVYLLAHLHLLADFRQRGVRQIILLLKMN